MLKIMRSISIFTTKIKCMEKKNLNRINSFINNKLTIRLQNGPEEKSDLESAQRNSRFPPNIDADKAVRL